MINPQTTPTNIDVVRSNTKTGIKNVNAKRNLVKNVVKVDSHISLSA